MDHALVDLVDLIPSSTYPTTAWGEREIQARIDRAVLRGLADAAFARAMLANPSILMEGAGCTPQQYLKLTSIRAGNVVDFARQAEALFWPSRVHRPHALPEARPVAAAL